MRFEKAKVTKGTFYTARKPIKIQDIITDNIVTSKLVKTKTNSDNLIGYLDKAIRPLISILTKISGYVKTFKVKDGDKDKAIRKN